MPDYNPDWPRDDRDLLVSDLFTGRWSVASRLAHRDTGARRAECPTCFGAGLVPSVTALHRDAVHDIEMTLADLFSGRWSAQSRRARRAIDASHLDCLACRGTGAVSTGPDSVDVADRTRR